MSSSTPHLPAVLPLILAGPILRRAEPTLVSVWVALSNAAEVTLTLYEGGIVKTPSSGTYNGGTLVPLKSPSTVAAQFGTGLYIALVVAEPALPLRGGVTYSYVLSFNGSDAEMRALLQGDDSLGYEDDALPTFALPPPSLSDLVILHGSCRKPHGRGHDALAYVDDVIKDNRGDALKRPHQLFLTGDQIYADDVSEALLPWLTELGTRVVGPEVLPVDPPVDLTQYPAGKRQALVVGQGLLTSEDASSHLLTFAEFCAMYLFVWSDVAWPDFLQGVDADDPVNLFRSTLPNVRRALANVPVYMILDDHEVTDDWFLSGEWRTNVLGNDLGRAIVRNALAAYTIFQAWGNDPMYFRTPEAVALLSEIQTMFPSGSTNGFDALVGFGGAASIRWNYVVPGPNHRVIVLDTRTRRGYATPTSNPALLDNSAFTEEFGPGFTTPAVTVTFVVSAAPAIGLAVLEELVQPLARYVTDIKRKTGEPTGQMKTDFEAWSFNPGAFETLLARLYDLGNVVLFGGDVHYSFSSYITYWKHGDGVRRIVQLTSSALKNQATEVQTVLCSQPLAQHIFGELLHPERLGWHGPRPVDPNWPFNDPPPAFHRFRLFSIPILMPTLGWPTTTTLQKPSDWSWRLQLVRDERSDDPAAPEPDRRPEAIHPVALDSLFDVSPTTPTDEMRKGYQAVAVRHAKQLKKGGPRRVFWDSSLGRVTLKFDGTNWTVRHELLSINEEAEPPDKDKPRPYLAHEIAFTPIGESEPQIPTP